MRTYFAILKHMNSICAFNKCNVYWNVARFFCSSTQNFYFILIFFFRFISKKWTTISTFSRNVCERSVASESHWCAHPFPILLPVPCVCTVFVFTLSIFLFQFKNIKLITKLEFILGFSVLETPNSVTKTKKRISNNWIVHTDKQVKETRRKRIRNGNNEPIKPHTEYR